MTLKVIKWFPYKYQKDDFFNRIDDNSYLIVEKNNLQNILPQEMHGYLRDNKFGEHHLVVKKVDEESRSTFAFSNINRIDWEGGRYVINEDQWAVFWNSGQSTASDSGAFLQHGDYPDRTRPIEESEDFVRHVL